MAESIFLGPRRRQLPSARFPRPTIDPNPADPLPAPSRARSTLPFVAALKAERDGPTEISASCLLVGLHLADALTDPIALGFGESVGDGQKQLAHGVAGNVAAKVKQAKRDSRGACAGPRSRGGASKAERNSLSSFGAMTTSPFASLVKNEPPSPPLRDWHRAETPGVQNPSPKATFKIDPMNGRKVPESGLWLRSWSRQSDLSEGERSAHSRDPLLRLCPDRGERSRFRRP